MKSIALKKKTSCWKGYTNIVNGKLQFKKKGKRTVPNCKPIKGKKQLFLLFYNLDLLL